MKKIIILITALLSFSVAAEGEGKHEMHAFYFMNVSNPVAVVGAIDKFAARTRSPNSSPWRRPRGCRRRWCRHRPPPATPTR